MWEQKCSEEDWAVPWRSSTLKVSPPHLCLQSETTHFSLLFLFPLFPFPFSHFFCSFFFFFLFLFFLFFCLLFLFFLSSFHFFLSTTCNQDYLKSLFLTFLVFDPFFSCPGQLNRWHCHSLSQWVSETDFWFQSRAEQSRAEQSRAEQSRADSDLDLGLG